MYAFTSFEIDELLDPDAGKRLDFTYSMELVDAMRNSHDQFNKKNKTRHELTRIQSQLFQPISKTKDSRIARDTSQKL